METKIISIRKLKPGKINVIFGKESKSAYLYKKKNGKFVFWSPFTRQRTVITMPRKKYYFESQKIKELEKRLEASRKCPEKIKL